jgi:hypothetical protein
MRPITLLVLVIFIAITVYAMFFYKGSTAPATVTHTIALAPEGSHYLLDGVARKGVVMKRGETHRFELDVGEHHVYFTRDPEGGEGCPGSILEDENKLTKSGQAVITLMISKNATPGTFYYQSLKGKGMGGKIEIV